MNDIKISKKTIFICILLILIAGGLHYLLTKKDNELLLYETDTDIYLKKYGVNEYIPVYVTEEDMAKKYLNDFKNKMINDPNEAYNVLNKGYRAERFESIESFIEYLDEYIGTSTYSMTVDKYEVKSIGGSKYYNVYTNNNKQYIFKENSIMDYEVYLDPYTIPIE